MKKKLSSCLKKVEPPLEKENEPQVEQDNPIFAKLKRLTKLEIVETSFEKS